MTRDVTAHDLAAGRIARRGPADQPGAAQPAHERARAPAADVLADHADGDAGPLQPGVPQRRRRPRLSPRRQLHRFPHAGDARGVHRDGRYQRRRRGGHRPRQWPARPLRHHAAAGMVPASAARTVNETVFTLARGALLLAAAMALGFRFHGTVLDAAAGVVVVTGAGGCHERPVRPHRRPAASPGRRPIRRDDDHDAVHVRLGGVRAAEHDAGVDAHRGRAESCRSRRGRAPRQRPGHRHHRRHDRRARAAAALWALATLWPRNLRRTR